MTMLVPPVPLTDIQVKQLLLAEVKAISDEQAAELLNLWWIMYAGKENVYAGLQYWYCRRALLDYRMGQISDQVTVKTGNDQINLREQFQNLGMLRTSADAEIAKLEDWGRSSLTSAAPVSTLPDAYADRLAMYRPEL